MNIIDQINIILVVIVGIVFILSVILVYVVLRGRMSNSEKEKKKDEGKVPSVASKSTKEGIPIESVYKFLEFDEVKDNMIIRKAGKQYVMVIDCHGINYDLLSEDEKYSVEEGFVQFLNTINFPVQLYIQTRSLNLRDILQQYEDRINILKDAIEKLDIQIQNAKSKGNKQLIDQLSYERKKKMNILEYGEDISDYTARMNQNRNILQQKTYVIVSYFTAELGDIGKYSKEEITDMCFSELYTRCQTLISSLASASVFGKVIDSEGLAELLYVAYNRDDSEKLQFSKAMDAQFDTLYSTGKDVLEKKKEKIEKEIFDEAVDLASNGILEANRINNAKRRQLVKNKALDIISDYKDQMTEELYEESKKQVRNSDGTITVKEKRKIKRPTF